MLTEGLIGLIVAPLKALFSMLPSADASFLDNWDYIRSILVDILTGVGCLLPMKEFIPLVTFQCAVYAFKLVWAILLRIKSLIPGLGG